jgi:cation transport ATPase
MTYLRQWSVYIYTLLLLQATSFALKVTVPYEENRDIVTAAEEITYNDSKESFMNTIKLANSYLWFFVAVICFGVLIYAGFQFISARGDDAQAKKSVDMLIYAGIGIVVALLAYTIVNLATNFF